MTTVAAIVQKTDEGYKLRIGDQLISMPEDATQSIDQAINAVSAFNVEHILVIKQLWDGQGDFSPDVQEFGYE